MPANRFYVDMPLESGETITCTGNEAIHIRKVMRARIGDTIELCNGRGSCAQATILSIDAASLIVTIEDVDTAEVPKRELHLWQALVRPSKLDLILEKGTELGVTHFHFFPAENSEKKQLSENQSQRVQHLCISALKQSGRLYLPKVYIEALEPSEGSILYGDISKDAPSVYATELSQVVHFVNGPEAGFTEKELALFIEKGWIGVSLSDGVLRTETAAITAAALIQAKSTF